MAFVYRYIDKNDFIVKYIGMVNGDDYSNLIRRIKQHTRDKWYKESLFDIDYIILETKNDAETLEGHFIAKYKTYNYYNIMKSKWGFCSFINKNQFIWSRYIPKNNLLKDCRLIETVVFDFNSSDFISNCENNLLWWKQKDIVAIETSDCFVVGLDYITNLVYKQYYLQKNKIMFDKINNNYLTYQITMLNEKIENLNETIKEQKQLISSLKKNTIQNQITISLNSFSNMSNLSYDELSNELSEEEKKYLLEQQDLFYFYAYIYDFKGNIIGECIDKLEEIIVKDYITNKTIVYSKNQVNGLECVLSASYLTILTEYHLFKCNMPLNAIQYLIRYYKEKIDELLYYKKEMVISDLSELLIKIKLHNATGHIYIDNNKEIVIFDDVFYQFEDNRLINKENPIESNYTYIEKLIKEADKVVYTLDIKFCPHFDSIQSVILKYKQSLSKYLKMESRYKDG